MEFLNWQLRGCFQFIYKNRTVDCDRLVFSLLLKSLSGRNVDCDRLVFSLLLKSLSGRNVDCDRLVFSLLLKSLSGRNVDCDRLVFSLLLKSLKWTECVTQTDHPERPAPHSAHRWRKSRSTRIASGRWQVCVLACRLWREGCSHWWHL